MSGTVRNLCSARFFCGYLLSLNAIKDGKLPISSRCCNFYVLVVLRYLVESCSSWLKGAAYQLPFAFGSRNRSTNILCMN